MPMLKAAARSRGSVEGRIGQARFIRRELIARRAHILQQLHRMPEPLADQPAVGQLAGVYWQRLRDLLTEPEPSTDDEEREEGRHSIKKSFMTKVRSPLLGYGSDFELLQYVFDLNLWSALGSKKKQLR